MVSTQTSQPSGAEQRLYDLDIKLPAAPEPLGAYVAVVQTGRLLFLSGMLPILGGKPHCVGQIGADLTMEQGCTAAEIACLNGIAVARKYLGSLNKVSRVVRLGVSMVTASDFREHPKIADAASEILIQVFGKEKISTRLIAGVTSLPLGAPIVLEIIFEIEP